jgi:hypothetical protein
MLDRQQSDIDSVKSFQVSAGVIGAFLMKLAKHMALIAFLLIAGRLTGRFTGGQLGIFLTVVSAALLHSIGWVLQRRLFPPAGLSRLGP